LFLGHDEDDEEIRVLTRAKANYAKNGDQIQLCWVAGVLTTFSTEHGISLEELGRARQTFKDAIDKLTARDINVSHLKTAPRNYAPKVIKEEGLSGEHNPRTLRKAMMSLID